MRYLATIDGVEREINVEELGGDSYRLTLDADEYDLDLRRVGPTSFSILTAGRSFDFSVLREGDELVVASRGATARLTLLSGLRRAERRRGGRSEAGRAELRAMMPGRVVNVLVGPGEAVEAGQGLVVVEAMKMENELKSPKSGKIADVKVVAGQTVEKNDLLVIIE